MRSFHVGMIDEDEYSSEACNPMEMAEDLAVALNVSSRFNGSLGKKTYT